MPLRLIKLNETHGYLVYTTKVLCFEITRPVYYRTPDSEYVFNFILTNQQFEILQDLIRTNDIQQKGMFLTGFGVNYNDNHDKLFKHLDMATCLY